MMYEELSPSEMLCAFLDGELPETQISSLFYAMAQNTELQAELRQLLAVRNAVQAMPLSIPAQLQDAIFERSGLGNHLRPATVIKSGAVMGTLAMIFKSRAFAMVLSGVLASTATFAFMHTTQVIPDPVMITKSTPVPSVETKVVIEKIDATTSQLASAFKDGFEKGVTERLENTHGVIAENNATDNYIPNQKPNEEGEIVTLGAQKEEVSEQQRQIIADSAAFARRFAFKFTPQEEVIPTPPLLQNFMAFVRGSAAYSLVRLNIPAPSDPAFNNTSAGLLYRVDDRNFIGMEVGRENFMQQYRGIEDGIPFRYEQNYPAIWGGAVYQHNFPKLVTAYGIQPFARIMAGGTEVGPLFKTAAGIYYEYNNSIGVNAAVEGTSLFYNHQQNWFSTQKIGFTYGVFFRL
ncbi:MAG TPA: hypothetical protein VEC36_08055 [Patescibacteria group bacterium]|nr:hypothetical protein [Patescibacteria group bacterium]